MTEEDRPPELAFYPTSDLIRELVSRETFYGMILCSGQEERRLTDRAEGNFFALIPPAMRISDAQKLLSLVLEQVSEMSVEEDG